ncbi:MAG: META domain-containing protein [Sulfurimonadaceae bacterium]
MYKSLFSAIAFSLVIMGCAAAEPTPTAETTTEKSSQTLEGPKWKLLSFGLTRMAVPQKAFIIFKDGRYSGNGGCNSIGGGYSVEGSKITFTEGMSTMMACPELDLEQKYLNDLGSVDAYVIDGDTLDLQSQGKSTLHFKRE